MPLLPPVTSATLPFNPRSMLRTPSVIATIVIGHWSHTGITVGRASRNGRESSKWWEARQRPRPVLRPRPREEPWRTVCANIPSSRATERAPQATRYTSRRRSMRLVDLSHPWNMHTPGWVGYPGSKIYYTQTLQTNRIVSQRVETSLHVGTHLDGPMHAADGAGDMASLPLTKLVHEGVIVDISDVVEDWSIITPKHITDRMEVKRGDIVILHTGYHRYYEGRPQQDLTRYFCMHPGGTRELAQWMHDMQISWWGIDAGSGDHPMNTTIRYMRPDLTRRFEEKVGKPVREFFGAA